MQINVSGHQVVVTPALRDYATGKLERVVRHFDHLHDVTVTLSVEKLLQKAEATLHCANSKIIHADAQATDMYAAIDALADKLDRQIKKHKEKITNHNRDSVRQARYG
ncbi:MAG: ribosome-associated translation inhibitor RaiA [Xanthomonadales bacterium PRO7]|jgi:putative sigma-54 modulation protein|nr:ribosome-associated translation inhibitor RaiA [Xanthomonadales bacterium PRO7]HMM56627.1 ribosome-associated translation inhibitor RaiA [Rudaea sp.]